MKSLPTLGLAPHACPAVPQRLSRTNHALEMQCRELSAEIEALKAKLQTPETQASANASQNEAILEELNRLESQVKAVNASVSALMKETTASHILLYVTIATMIPVAFIIATQYL